MDWPKTERELLAMKPFTMVTPAVAVYIDPYEEATGRLRPRPQDSGAYGLWQLAPSSPASVQK